MISMRKIIFLLFCLALALTSLSTLAEEVQEIDVAGTDTPHTLESDPSILQYLNIIAEQEKLHGAYDPQLSEQLLGLGLLYQNLEQYEEADKALSRALHIRKVNDGLQSMTQVPVLEALLKANTAARNWDELDENYHLLLWVHQRNLDPGDPEMLTIYNRVGSWLNSAYANRLLDKDPER